MEKHSFVISLYGKVALGVSEQPVFHPRKKVLICLDWKVWHYDHKVALRVSDEQNFHPRRHILIRLYKKVVHLYCLILSVDILVAGEIYKL